MFVSNASSLILVLSTIPTFTHSPSSHRNNAKRNKILFETRCSESTHFISRGYPDINPWDIHIGRLSHSLRKVTRLQSRPDASRTRLTMADRHAPIAAAALQVPVLPLHDDVLFPRTYLRLAITSSSSIQLLKDLVSEARASKSSRRKKGDTTSPLLTLAVFTRRSSKEDERDGLKIAQPKAQAKDVF